MSADTAKVLRDALALIADESTWIKGLYNDGACYCAAGAIDAALDTDTDDDLAWRARGALIRTAGQYVSVTNWNDRPERTHAEVVATFEAAIVAEEAAS